MSPRRRDPFASSPIISIAIPTRSCAGDRLARIPSEAARSSQARRGDGIVNHYDCRMRDFLAARRYNKILCLDPDDACGLDNLLIERNQPSLDRAWTGEIPRLPRSF